MSKIWSKVNYLSFYGIRPNVQNAKCKFLTGGFYANIRTVVKSRFKLRRLDSQKDFNDVIVDNFKE